MEDDDSWEHVSMLYRKKAVLDKYVHASKRARFQARGHAIGFILIAYGVGVQSSLALAWVVGL